MASPSPKATPPSQSEPLVNENLPADTLDSLRKQLADSREEVKRTSLQLEQHRASGARSDEAAAHLAKQIEVLKTENKELAERNAVQKDSLIGSASSGEYTGPTQRDIYLALVSGFTSTIDPLKGLDDQKVSALSKSVCGLSEVFFKEASSRKSFN